MTTPREKAADTAQRAARTAKRRRDPLVKVEDERKVTQLWIAGATRAEIKQATGLSESTISRVKKRALKAGMKDRDQLAEKLRERELLTLDRLQRAHWTAALQGNVGSSKIVLSCVDKRAKLLGLDAPIKVDATVRSELDSQIEALVSELEAEGVVTRQD